MCTYRCCRCRLRSRRRSKPYRRPFHILQPIRRSRRGGANASVKRGHSKWEWFGQAILSTRTTTGDRWAWIVYYRYLTPRQACAGFRCRSASARPISQNLPAGTITSLTDKLTDFSETAAAIAGLDLIITVDTAAAHLAGALGKPVWLMLPFVPDWR